MHRRQFYWEVIIEKNLVLMFARKQKFECFQHQISSFMVYFDLLQLGSVCSGKAVLTELIVKTRLFRSGLTRWFVCNHRGARLWILNKKIILPGKGQETELLPNKNDTGGSKVYHIKLIERRFIHAMASVNLIFDQWIFGPNSLKLVKWITCQNLNFTSTLWVIARISSEKCSKI